MSWQIKYYFNYFPLWANNPNTVGIYQNSDEVIVPIEIRGHKSPFTVELPEIEHKFQTVRGKGCTINLLSETDNQFFDELYFVDPQTYMVKHYVDGILDFVGFLNAEMISEPYDVDRNYPISITGNDGFSLMDRFSFVQADATHYTGIKSKFEILQIVFGKIALPFLEYRISLSTTFTGYSGVSSSTILHESYVDCSNFYDEDDEPMTLREVVESILAPYGALITVVNGRIYITDINTLADSENITYKIFSLSDGHYMSPVIEPNLKSISEEIGYMGTGQTKEKSGGVNKQVVTYSPYPVKEILEKSINDIGEFETVPDSWSTRLGFYSKILGNNEYWTKLYGSLGWFEATYSYLGGSGDLNSPDVHFSYSRQNGNISLYDCNIRPYLNISGIKRTGSVPRIKYMSKSGVCVNINGDILVKTKDNPYDSSQSSTYAKEVSICVMLKIGDLYYNSLSREWQSDFCTSFLRIGGSIEDEFTSFSKSITLGNINEDIVIHGEFRLQIWSDIKAMLDNRTNVETLNPSEIQEIWLRNLSVSLTNLDGTDISDSDIQYIGLLDKTFKDEGEEIKLTCGTDAQFSDRGKIMWYNEDHFESIKTWTRAGQTFKIEELLLNSLSSNYRSGFISLLNMKLKNSFSFMNVITDTYVGARKLMIKSAIVNYADDTVECSLVEVSPDALTITLS